jgi:hypothetical protein
MAGTTRQSREVKKWIAARRAQFALRQTLDRIDFVEDELGPETEALLSGKVHLQIEASNKEAAQSIIHVIIDDQTQDTEEEDLPLIEA